MASSHANVVEQKEVFTEDDRWLSVSGYQYDRRDVIWNHSITLGDFYTLYTCWACFGLLSACCIVQVKKFQWILRSVFFIASCKEIIYQSLVVKHYSVLCRGRKRSTVFGVNWLNTRFLTRALPSYMMWRQTDREPFRLCIISDCVKVIESCLGFSTTICRERFLLLNWYCKECI